MEINVLFNLVCKNWNNSKLYIDFKLIHAHWQIYQKLVTSYMI